MTPDGATAVIHALTRYLDAREARGKNTPQTRAEYQDALEALYKALIESGQR